MLFLGTDVGGIIRSDIQQEIKVCLESGEKRQVRKILVIDRGRIIGNNYKCSGNCNALRKPPKRGHFRKCQ
jgi:hypothetical protein